MNKIIFSEALKAFCIGFFVGKIRSSPFHKLNYTVTDKTAYLLKTSFREGKGTKCVIDGGVKVTEGVKKRAVKVEDYCFIYMYQSFAFGIVIF